MSHVAGRLRSRIGVLAVAAGIVLLVTVLLVTMGVSRGAPPQPDPTPTPSPTATPSPSPSPTEEPTPSPTPSPTPAARCPYDGEEVAAVPTAIPVLVSIDNHPQARPATGLQAADIVFENPVQGNSTRFTALFACDMPPVVGPVRSGRWIQVDLWQQLRVLPIIFGAAPYTTNYFAQQGMPYIDGNVEPWPFFSRSSRPAPYNVYMDTAVLQDHLRANPDLAGRVERAGDPRALLAFDDDWAPPPEARSVTTVDVSTASFWFFGWRYNEESRGYERRDGGGVTTDAATGEPLSHRVVIVQRAASGRTFADPRPDADPPKQELIGTGAGTVYVDGVAFDVAWSRASASDVTQWTLPDGEPLVLPPGRIWWLVLPTTSSLTES